MLLGVVASFSALPVPPHDLSYYYAPNHSPCLVRFATVEKNKAYIVTFVDRATRCILSWAVAFQADEDVVQGALDHVPQAQ